MTESEGQGPEPQKQGIKEFFLNLPRRLKLIRRRIPEAPGNQGEPSPGGSDWELPFEPTPPIPEPKRHQRRKPQRVEPIQPEPPPSPDLDRRFAREVQYLAKKYGDPDLQILPENEWAIHYQNGPDAQRRAIDGLLNGTAIPSSVASDMTPDALLYDLSEFESQGLPVIETRIMDAATGIRTYDYQRFAEFASSMQETHMNHQDVERIYGTIAADRSREIMLTTYDHTNQERVLHSMERMASEGEMMGSHLSGMDQILNAARLAYFNQHQRVPTMGEPSGVTVAPNNMPFYESIRDAYSEYITHGDDDAYRRLVAGIHEYYSEERESADQTQQGSLPPSGDQSGQDQGGSQGQQEQTPQQEEMSEPPAATDEYSQPTERSQTGPEFEITPPQTGYYVRERHTHYDRATKTWSHTKNLSSYAENSNASDKKTISGIVNRNSNMLLELPIPPEHIVDMDSLTASGQKPEIFQDETGTFYLKKADAGDYHIDFGKEHTVNTIPPTQDEYLALYQGQLSDATEVFLSSLSGSTMEKVAAIQRFIRQQHIYPDDPKVVQDGIRNGSTGDNYIQNLDNAPELECYSAATLFAALSRHEGIPTRVIIGDFVTKATNGKAIIDTTTKHAWDEVWDGAAWITIDATPSKPGEQGDPGDVSGEPSGDQGESGEGQGEQPGDQGEPQGGEQGQSSSGTEEGSAQQGKSSSGNDLLPNKNASDSKVDQGKANMDQAEDVARQAQEKQEELRQKMDDVASFEDMEKLQEELRKSDALFEDMKEKLKEKAQAKEKQMKKKLEDELKEMEKDGFLDPQRRKKLQEDLERDKFSRKDFDRLKETVANSPDYLEFKNLRREMQPLVHEALTRLIPLLPKVETIQTDTERSSGYGEFDADLVSDPESYLTGKVMRPRTARPETRPYILADFMIDVSHSMGDGQKLQNAKFLLVFFNELFKEMHKRYGYIHYSISSFADDIMPIKTTDQDPADSTPYTYPDGSRSTVNARIIQGMKLRNGTDILKAVKTSSRNLDTLSREFPNYFSALYFTGDGKDIHGQDSQIIEFMSTTNSQKGFGRHRRSAIMLGGPEQRDVLATLFGDKNTAVASDLKPLINTWVSQFGRDAKQYMTRMGY